MPVSEVGLGRDHRCEEHDVCEGNGHAAASKRMAHIPRIAEEDDALLRVWTALLYGWKERIGHASKTVLQ
jgi:hypothetical protein